VTSPFDARPIIVAIAGPNGAGKSTFHEAHLQQAGLRFVNADELARELVVDAYQAADAAGQLRKALVEQRESFVFETVFSDPVGDKLEFLKGAEEKGYTVVLCFIGLDGPDLSVERVAMRVLQGGHDVPTSKLRARYPRTMENLAKAIGGLAHVIVFDNSDLRRPFRKVAAYERGKLVEKQGPLPRWFPRGR
jgi:predicted ABC-type ATPase